MLCGGTSPPEGGAHPAGYGRKTGTKYRTCIYEVRLSAGRSQHQGARSRGRHRLLRLKSTNESLSENCDPSRSRGPQPPAAKARLNPGTEDRKKQCLRAFPRNTRLLAGLRRCDPLSTIKNDFRKLSSRSRRGLWAVKKHKEKESPKRFGKMQSERLPVRRHPRRRTATRRKLGQSSAGGEPQNPHERFLEPRRT